MSRLIRGELAAPLVTEIVEFGCTQHGTGVKHWPAHRHSFAQVDVVLQGAVKLLGPGFSLRRGLAAYVPPLVRHGHQADRGFCSAMFKFYAAPRYWKLLGKTAFQIELSPLMLACVEAAVHAVETQQPLCTESVTAALTFCLIEGLRQRAPAAAMGPAPTDGYAQLAALLARVEAEPYARWSVAGLAAECGVSADHFRRVFRAQLGHSPLEFLARTRLRAAARELAMDPRTSIKQVAARSGFATVHAFSRAFRRVIGVTPGKYQQLERAEL